MHESLLVGSNRTGVQGALRLEGTQERYLDRTQGIKSPFKKLFRFCGSEKAHQTILAQAPKHKAKLERRKVRNTRKLPYANVQSSGYTANPRESGLDKLSPDILCLAVSFVGIMLGIDVFQRAIYRLVIRSLRFRVASECSLQQVLPQRY
jgi:hypothetical protein